MKHIINQDEIFEAIEDFINKNGVITDGKKVTIDMTAGRKDGYEATIEVVEITDEKPAETVTTKRGGKRGPRKTAPAPVSEGNAADKGKDENPELEDAPPPEVEEETPSETEDTVEVETPADEDDDNLFGDN